MKKKFFDFFKNNKLLVSIIIFLGLMFYSSDFLKNKEITELWFNLLGTIISWPVAILIIILKFQTAIIELVSRVTKLRIGENEVTFLETLEKIDEEFSVEDQGHSYRVEDSTDESDDYELLAYLEPKMAILQTWVEYEKLLRDKFEELLDQRRINYQKPKEKFVTVTQIMFQLFKNKLINENIYEIFKGLSHLRNSIAHGQDVDVSIEMALEYNKTLEKLKKYIRNL